MKIWLDDIRPSPEGFVHAYSVNGVWLTKSVPTKYMKKMDR